MRPFCALFQIYWPAPVDWREECNWAGKDITVSFSMSHFLSILLHFIDISRSADSGNGFLHSSDSVLF